MRYRNQLRGLARKLKKEPQVKAGMNLRQNPNAYWRYANCGLHTSAVLT